VETWDGSLGDRISDLALVFAVAEENFVGWSFRGKIGSLLGVKMWAC
jgi:hypothetical protein